MIEKENKKMKKRTQEIENNQEIKIDRGHERKNRETKKRIKEVQKDLEVEGEDKEVDEKTRGIIFTTPQVIG